MDLRKYMGVPGEVSNVRLPASMSSPSSPGRPLLGPPSRLGRGGLSSFDPGPLVKVRGIPRPTGRAAASRDSCYVIKIPLGSRGTTATLERMAELAVEGSQEPAFVQEARAAVRECPSKDWVCEGTAIYDWTLNDVVTYRNDPVFLEYIQSPGYTLFVDGNEDCDGSSTFIACCDVSVGRGCRFGAYMLDREKAKDGEYSHVLCEMGIRLGHGAVRWMGQDVVAKRGFSWTPPESEWFGPPNYLVVANP